MVVIMATIPLPEREAREHDQTTVSLWFLERSSLHRISIMGVLSRYYHLFNQNFTGRRDNAMRRRRSDHISPRSNRLIRNANAAYNDHDAAWVHTQP